MNEITDEGIEILAPYFDGNATFRELKLENNEGITNKSLQTFAKIIELSHIENVEIKETSITAQSALVDSLASNALKYGFPLMYLRFR